MNGSSPVFIIQKINILDLVFDCADFVTDESFKFFFKSLNNTKFSRKKNPIEKLKCNFCLPDIGKHVNAQPTHLTKINKPRLSVMP